MTDVDDSLSLKARNRGRLVVGAFLTTVAYLVVSHANPAAAVIGCPFHALTGYDCFGCGMTRSTANFLFGNFRTALEYHPFGPVFMVGFAAMAGHHAAQLWAGRALDYRLLRIWRRIERPAWVAAALFLGVFGIVRFVGELTGFLTPI